MRFGNVVFGILLVLLFAMSAPAQSQLSEAAIDQIGKRIWQNECGGSVSGLTSWNTGENFASLGIGHFIWYPAGQTGPFEESFPPLVKWLQQSGAAVPTWLVQSARCPWADRAAFLRDHDSAKQTELRNLLSRTVSEQTRFIIARLAGATQRMQAAAGGNGALVAKNVQLLQQSAPGNFAMIDYVNFKGDGMDSRERYHGEGWGLLQVLENMQAASAADAPAAFAASAKAVLTRRVKNSPPERKEKQWLPGWLNRCARYGS